MSAVPIAVPAVAVPAVDGSARDATLAGEPGESRARLAAEPSGAHAAIAPPFVHLRMHSEFSVVDGLVRLDEVVKAAAADGQGALALTDAGNLFGAVRFYTAARKRGLKPILGADVWISNDTDRDAPFRMLLLVQDRTGYLSLCTLLSRAWLENAHRGRGEIRPEWLDAGAAGLIALSGAGEGEIGVALRAGNRAAALAAATRLAARFPQRFYLELQRAGRPGDDAACQATLGVAVELGVPVVATHPVQFVHEADFRAHEARVCIAEGTTLGDPKRPRRFTPQQYFKSRAEMGALFADVPVALANAVELARRCNLVLELGKPQLPRFPTPAGVTLDDHCRDLAQQGLERRLQALFADPAQRADRRAPYDARLALELGTIIGMGFPGYFLIVADFINWAKKNGCPVGPGRGSGAGSLVAYALGITDLDPLKYDLLFERFLNPERVSMPDFDIDFCQDNRDKVIDYVKRKYGADAVSQIATFGTLGAKAVVRDAGRVLELPYTRCDLLSKLIPHNPADPWTLERALAEEPAFGEAVAGDEEYGELIELARPLEGLTRNVGMHAGGVLIAPGKLTDFCPLYCAPGAQDAVISQFDKDDVEAIGLVKFDFLGLTTLTILELALGYVRKLDPGSQLDLEKLPLDDPRTYEIFKRGDTTAIFQFESRGMRELLKRARPDRLEDLIALNALYRPGPMELIPDYIERKHGRQRVVYTDPRVEPILSETYGVMVYQEQVMRIAQVVGAYSLGGADLLRRAMGKKKPEEMALHRDIFVRGAAGNGVSEPVATELFDLMEKFAGYGFNKCVIGSSVVHDALSGRRWTVNELFARRGALEVHVHALGEDWKLRARRVRDVVWNGKRPVSRLVTALGRRLVATANHPLRTLDGWTLLGDLRRGDRIAVPRRMATATPASWPQHALIVLGGLLSEGNTCHPSCLYYYNNQSVLLDDFAQAASRFERTVARVSRRSNGRGEVCLSTGADMRFQPGQRAWNARSRGLEPEARCEPVRSGAFEWAAALGLIGVKATAKHVPAGAFELCDEDLALLIGRMWSGDGFICGPNNTTPFYATSSAALADDVQTLLLRLGIVSRIQTKAFAYRGQRRPGHAVYLIGDDSIEAFVGRIGPYCLGKEAQVAALVQVRCARSTSKDTIPAAVRRWVDRGRRAQGMTWKALEGASDTSMKEMTGAGSSVKRGFRRCTIARLAETLGDTGLAALADAEVYWDTVVSVEDAGEDDVYDLEVDADHNFVVDGIVAHNSHSAAYALVAYQTAYFKAHHPAAFMAANLTAVMHETDKLKELIEDCKTLKLVIEPPDVNAGTWRFEPQDGRTIRYGLGGIKGTGQGAIETIVAARAAQGPFTSLFDFCARVDRQTVNRRVVEALARAGAFDRLNPHRHAVLATVGRAMEFADAAVASAGQASLFGADEPMHAAAMVHVAAPAWSEREVLSNEKLALGFYFSGHLFTAWEPEARRIAATRLADVRQSQSRNEAVRLTGIIVSARTQNTRRGRMGVIVLDDGTAQLELMVFAELFDRRRAILKEDELVFVTGRVRYDEFNQRLSVTADDVLDLVGARAVAQAQLRIDADGALEPARLGRVLQPWRARPATAPGDDEPANPGAPAGRQAAAAAAAAAAAGCRIVLRYRNATGVAALAFAEDWRVCPDDRLLGELREQPGVAAAAFTYPSSAGAH